MTEAFLHIVWEYRLLTGELITSDGREVIVHHPGTLNTDSGPDFFNARLRIGGIPWAGNVEVHVRSSDWKRHNHHADPAYDNCILHVVFKDDGIAHNTAGNIIPSLEIRSLIPAAYVEKCETLLSRPGAIACIRMVTGVDSDVLKATIEEAGEDRLRSQAGQLLKEIKAGDWQELFYRKLVRNFGFRVNAMPFEMLAASLPLSVIRKEASRLQNMEALLFGQSGFLKRAASEPYVDALKENYMHLARKYALTPIPSPAWKFLRLRPVNFPTVRIAQLAALLTDPSIFSGAPGHGANVFLKKIITASSYWDTHYRFGAAGEATPKTVGRACMENLVINTFVPFHYAWGLYTGNKDACAQAAEMLKRLPPENNSITRLWEAAGVRVPDAACTQALHQLFTRKCVVRECVSCRIGRTIITSP